MNLTNDGYREEQRCCDYQSVGVYGSNQLRGMSGSSKSTSMSVYITYLKDIKKYDRKMVQPTACLHDDVPVSSEKILDEFKEH